jgi:hypothetical protein
MNEELNRVTWEDLLSCIRHVENLQEEDFAKEIRKDKILDPIIINLQDSETEETKVIKTTVMLLVVDNPLVVLLD